MELPLQNAVANDWGAAPARIGPPGSSRFALASPSITLGAVAESTRGHPESLEVLEVVGIDAGDIDRTVRAESDQPGSPCKLHALHDPTLGVDDIVGGRWAILHTGALPAGTDAWTELDVATIRISEPSLTRWLHRKKAAAVVPRPDGFVYAAAGSGQPIAPPPPGCSANRTASTRTGVTV